MPAGIAIQAIPALVGLYVGNFVGFAAVRLFLILAIVLLGLYVMATVILVGSGAGGEARAALRCGAPTPPGASRAGRRRHPAAVAPRSAPAPEPAATAPGRPPAATGA